LRFEILRFAIADFRLMIGFCGLTRLHKLKIADCRFQVAKSATGIDNRIPNRKSTIENPGSEIDNRKSKIGNCKIGNCKIGNRQFLRGTL